MIKKKLFSEKGKGKKNLRMKKKKKENENKRKISEKNLQKFYNRCAKEGIDRTVKNWIY